MPKISELTATTLQSTDEIPVSRGTAATYKGSLANRTGNEVVTGTTTFTGDQTVTGTSYTGKLDVDSGAGTIDTDANGDLVISNPSGSQITLEGNTCTINNTLKIKADVNGNSQIQMRSSDPGSGDDHQINSLPTKDMEINSRHNSSTNIVINSQTIGSFSYDGTTNQLDVSRLSIDGGNGIIETNASSEPVFSNSSGAQVTLSGDTTLVHNQLRIEANSGLAASISFRHVDGGAGVDASIASKSADDSLEINNAQIAPIRAVINGQTIFTADYDGTDETFTVSGLVECETLKVTTGAGTAGQVLKSDVSGNATWQADSTGGDVVGPASAVDSNLAAYNTTTGKLIKDSGLATSTVLTTSSDLSALNNVAVTAPSTGEVLKYNGTAWAPATDSTGGTVTSVTGTAPISVATGTTTPVISLDNTAVTPAAYTNADITVDAQGRITAAANGSAGSGSTFEVTTASTGTTTVPAGMTMAKITIIGSGAGGSGAGFSFSDLQSGYHGSGGSGGGSGCIEVIESLPVKAGQSFYYDIAAGGAGGVGQGSSAQAGAGLPGMSSSLYDGTSNTNDLILTGSGGMGGSAPVSTPGGAINGQSSAGNGGAGGISTTGRGISCGGGAGCPGSYQSSGATVQGNFASGGSAAYSTFIGGDSTYTFAGEGGYTSGANAQTGAGKPGGGASQYYGTTSITASRGGGGEGGLAVQGSGTLVNGTPGISGGAGYLLIEYS